jgi:hypothetical protein
VITFLIFSAAWLGTVEALDGRAFRALILFGCVFVLASSGCASTPTKQAEYPGQFDTRPARVTRAR